MKTPGDLKKLPDVKCSGGACPRQGKLPPELASALPLTIKGKL